MTRRRTNPRVAPLFIAHTDMGVVLVDDQGRTLINQRSSTLSAADRYPVLTVDFVLGIDVAWQGQPYPETPALQAMLQAWGELSQANQARFMAALGLEKGR